MSDSFKPLLLIMDGSSYS